MLFNIRRSTCSVLEKLEFRGQNKDRTFISLIKFLLKQGIEKFIPKKRRHLVSITETAYPVRIKY